MIIYSGCADNVVNLRVSFRRYFRCAKRIKIGKLPLLVAFLPQNITFFQGINTWLFTLTEHDCLSVINFIGISTILMLITFHQTIPSVISTD